MAKTGLAWRKAGAVIAAAAMFIAAAILFERFGSQIQESIAGSYLGMLLYVAVFALSIVAVPVTAMPLIPLGARLWGVLPATALTTTGWTIGAMAAFFIARALGRPFVTKILPLQKIEKIERRIPEQNLFWIIFLLRAVTPFDGLSYVLGLATRVRTKTFFWATLLGLLPFSFAVSWLGSMPVGVMAAGLGAAGLISIVAVYRKIR